MAETQETHADIIAEMRMGNTGPYPFAYLIGRAGGLLGNVIEQVTVKELADRLEAAHGRELAASGNAAKLREALDEILSYIESFHKFITPGDGKELTALFAVADTIRNKARTALAAPPRNCEVGSVEEQVERWNNENPYPYEWDDRQYYDALDMLKWAQMPYEADAQKGGEE